MGSITESPKWAEEYHRKLSAGALNIARAHPGDAIGFGSDPEEEMSGFIVWAVVYGRQTNVSSIKGRKGEKTAHASALIIQPLSEDGTPIPHKYSAIPNYSHIEKPVLGGMICNVDNLRTIKGFPDDLHSDVLRRLAEYTERRNKRLKPTVLYKARQMPRSTKRNHV